MRRNSPFLATVLVLVLGIATGCTKKQPPAQREPASGSAGAAEDISYLPQDVFGPQAVPGATVLKPIDPRSLSESERKFGIAPRRSSEVEYQPGVIVMEQGDKAIRSIASNGLQWEFDANAPHVSEFQEGKIVFATGRAVGRIVGLKKNGASVTAVLGPIQLTDVIKNGKFTMDQAISADDMISYVAPDFPQPPEGHPEEKKTASSKASGDAASRVERAMVVSRVQGGVWTPMSVAETYSDGRRVTFQKIGNHWRSPRASPARMDPALRVRPYRPKGYVVARQQPPLDPGTGLQFPQAPSIQNPPLTPAKAAGTPPVVDVGDLRTVAVANPSNIGLQFYSKNMAGGLAIFAETLMNVNRVHMHFVLNIVNGRIVKCGIDMGGALGVKLYMDAHTTKEFQVNLHKRWWEPVDLTIPLGLGNAFGIPFSVTFNMMLEVNSGFSAKQSILHAEGDYTYKGGLWAGYTDGEGWKVATASDLVPRTDIGSSIQGISVGINSLVMACSVRAMVGIGAFGFNTGVYVGMRFDGTILRAPDEAFPCRQGTVEVYIDSGVGYSLPGFVVDVINKILSAFTKYQLERVGTLLKGPSDRRLFHDKTQIPGGCATPKQGAG
jgi:hypothetical protein